MSWHNFRMELLILDHSASLVFSTLFTSTLPCPVVSALPRFCFGVSSAPVKPQNSIICKNSMLEAHREKGVIAYNGGKSPLFYIWSTSHLSTFARNNSKRWSLYFRPLFTTVRFWPMTLPTTTCKRFGNILHSFLTTNLNLIFLFTF